MKQEPMNGQEVRSSPTMALKNLTAQIVQCGRQRAWRRAVDLLKKSIAALTEPDVITYSATISACEKGQRWITAVALLREMQHRHLEADVITCVIHTLLPRTSFTFFTDDQDLLYR